MKPIITPWLYFVITFLLSLAPVDAALAEKADYFVTASDLKDHPNSFKIIDARGYHTFLKGHIPGAIPADWQSLSNMEGSPGDEHWGTLANNSILTEKIQKLGLQKNDQIAVYSDTPEGWGEDGRIAWSLITAGFTNVRVLDGGYTNWSKQQYDTSVIPSLFTKKSVVTLSQRKTDLIIDTTELQQKYDQFLIIDTRTPEEFNGAMLYGEARGGHLPDAVNIPFTDLLNPDGTLRSAYDIHSIMEKKGIHKDSNIVTYCTAGIRSAHMAIVLKGQWLPESQELR